MLTDKQEKALRRYVRDTPPEDVAYAVVSDKTLKPGPFRMLPLLAYLRQDEGDPCPNLWVYSTVLLNYADTHRGLLNWRIPLTERNIPVAVRLLGSLGWDGRVWPQDGGWPEESSQESVGLRLIMTDMGMGSIMVFPPDAERGSAALSFLVSRSNGHQFVLPPQSSLEEGVEVRQDLDERLRGLMTNLDLFRAEVTPAEVTPPTTE